MIKFGFVVAASAALVMPALANSISETSAGTKLAQIDACIGPNCADRAYRDHRYGDRAYGYERDREWRFRHGDRGCREVTIRDRRGSEVVVRHERRCD